MTRFVSRMLFALLCLGVGGMAFAQEAEETATVGDLAVRLARLVTDKDYSPEGAVEILNKVGIQVDGEISETLTEATMAAALNQIGYEVVSSSPQSSVSLQQFRQMTGMLEDGPGALPCPPGFPGQSCNSVKCAGGANADAKCTSDADCPGSFCRVPPGIAKKVASPTDG